MFFWADFGAAAAYGFAGGALGGSEVGDGGGDVLAAAVQAVAAVAVEGHEFLGEDPIFFGLPGVGVVGIVDCGLDDIELLVPPGDPVAAVAVVGVEVPAADVRVLVGGVPVAAAAPEGGPPVVGVVVPVGVPVVAAVMLDWHRQIMVGGFQVEGFSVHGHEASHCEGGK